MIALASLWRAATTLPKPIWYALTLTAALLMLVRWHDRGLAAAHAAGAAAQAAADRARLTALSAAAARAQHDRVTALTATQAQISKGQDDELAKNAAVIVSRAADLRLRWAAHGADRDHPGGDRTTAVPRAAGRPDDAACAAAGWVSFAIASAAAEAADRAIAKDDAWIAWATAQAAAWPGPW